ncbi:TrkA family potassium uptake protein [Quadrisphaera sp. DSM 44207]|uniref:potassium channel family protein n=1 Tax=Quadrisphaera sp. DSM 44207 TaxID=1881057 RepID=UPI00088346E0|nr:TrkA family potassium uptake protein [Quadrisphaera sp. DSM 44207]SDQ50705.1 trk system potassium uptake protein TrkA [Quadrisphaera sp. DSM 44207]
MARYPLGPGRRVPRSAHRLAEADSVVVIGLGRFGRSLALQLVDSGAEVLGIDEDEDLVQSLHGQLTHVVRADSTREEALQQLAVQDFDRAVVGIGNDVEASILTASLLMEFGVPQVWAKATSEAHGRILHQIGVHHVVHPESEMGRRVAHLVRGSMLDYVEVGQGFAMVTTSPPAEIVGRPLGQTGLRQRHGVTVVAVRHAGDGWTHAGTDTVLAPADTIIVAGPVRDAERFSLLRRP